MKRWLIGFFGVMVSGAVLASSPAELRRRMEESMVLTGTVVVASDGTVQNYTIDKADKVPAAVLDLVAKTIEHWLFAPVLKGDSAIAAKARMSLRVLATSADGRHFSLSVNGVNFGDDASSADAQGPKLARGTHRPSPAYPGEAIAAGVSGTAYLLLRLDGRGRVVDAAVEQVNLGVVGSDTEMNHFREVLARASLLAAKHWFVPPPSGVVVAADGHWLARVPVAYFLSGEHLPRYGEWKAYVPGPRQLPSWAMADPASQSASADAIPDDGLYGIDQKFHLIAPPGKS